MTVETRESFCRVCHAACPVEVDVDLDDNRIVAVRGVRDDPLFEGYTCIKGRQLADQIHHPDRLRAAYRRAPGGHLEEIASSSALDEVAQRLADVVERHGPAAVATYTGTGGYQNSCALETARGFHKGLGSSSFYTSVTIDQPAKTTAPGISGWWGAGFHDFRTADVLVAVGYNPMVSSYGPVGGLQGTNPTTVLRRARDRGLKLVVIDPRRTELATFADIHLQVVPGEDAAVLAGFLRVILADDLHDADFCEQWVDGLDRLRAEVDPFTPEVVARRAGIDADDLVAAARMFAGGRRGTLGTGTGPNMAPDSSLTEHLAVSCNIVCGRVNREGDRLESGAFLYPGTPRKAQAIAPRDPRTGARHRFRGLRGYIGEMLCSVISEEILEPGDGQIRALIVSGGNPAVAWPDQELTMRALRDLELLVVIDHRMTATAREAHYVIAPRLSLERADVPHLMDRWFAAPYTNYTEAVVEPEGDVVNEWEVFWGLARRLGIELPTAGGDLAAMEQPSDDDVIDMVYARSRMSTAEVRASRGVIHEDKALVVQPADPDCTARFDVAPDSMMNALNEVVHQRTSAERLSGFDPERYPFRLVSRRLKAVINSLGPELPNLAAKGTTNAAYMHPDDLAELGLADGDLVDITSPTGQIRGVCEGASDVRPGVVSMAHSWGDGSLSDDKVRDIGTPTSRLTSTTAAHDPITGMVVQSAIPVNVTAALVEAG